MKVLLKSAKIVDQKSKYHLKKRDILIEKGIIIEISNKIEAKKGVKVIELKNLHVSCGWFDTSVCFGEPGFEERETIENGLQVAAKSGFTAVALNPNTNPVLDNKSAIEFIKKSSENSLVKIYPIGNVTKCAKGDELAELYDMHNSGALAFGDYKQTITNVNLMKIALLYAQNFDGLILNFPQEKALSSGYANEGENSTKLGLKANPNIAEEMQISRDLYLLEYTKGKLHIPCISTEKSVKLISDAKKKGLNVTCSVAVHNLVLTDDELQDFNTNYRVNPPLRTKKDTKALLKGLKNGTIDMITSDHNPIDIEHKKVAFENAMSGTIGLESLFGAVNSVLDLETSIACFTDKPRERFGLITHSIEKNAEANLTLFNPDAEYTFSKKDILSTSKNAAFLGKKLKGKVYGVINDDNVIIG